MRMTQYFSEAINKLNKDENLTVNLLKEQANVVQTTIIISIQA